jgi:hypothetical protein
MVGSAYLGGRWQMHGKMYPSRKWVLSTAMIDDCAHLVLLDPTESDIYMLTTLNYDAAGCPDYEWIDDSDGCSKVRWSSAAASTWSSI